MTNPIDLRPVFFQGAGWYNALGEPADNEVSVWRLAKSDEQAWWIDLLNVGFGFALQHGLEDSYRQRYAGIRPGDLSGHRARAEGRSVFHPIWEIANELIVGAYFQQVLGWTFLRSEPNGSGARVGDLEFRTGSGKVVFVEVKTPTELRPTAPSFNRADYAPKIRAVVARAYRQLPADDRSVVVVIVGDWLTEVSFGILHTDVFAALFGKYIVKFQAFEEPAAITYAGPSFHDMVVGGAKHRRLGAVAGMVVRGLEEPRPVFYSIDNPYAYASSRIPHADLVDVQRYVVDSEGAGAELEGVTPEVAWSRMTLLAQSR